MSLSSLSPDACRALTISRCDLPDTVGAIVPVACRCEPELGRCDQNDAGRCDLASIVPSKIAPTGDNEIAPTRSKGSHRPSSEGSHRQTGPNGPVHSERSAAAGFRNAARLAGTPCATRLIENTIASAADHVNGSAAPTP